jgi:hypothetical protein
MTMPATMPQAIAKISVHGTIWMDGCHAALS